ncbi:MAG: GNAT family N-acetyltransferase [Agathobacter sp.]|nr:GNAT family N-acetyltransferase [Agathobacter sp.]
MDIVISEYIEYNHNEIINLYESVGWVNYVEHPERLREGYKNSLCVLAAYKDTELAGILRTVGDNATILFIQDIIVLPKYQRMGIGTKLIKSAMEKYKDVYQIELLTDDTEKTISFYKSVGLTPTNEIGALSFIRM